ncbi:hypothetical protein ACFVDQ_18165 [Streptomyces sp. NPDC057684]|uniref:hypothetical protein n=1 Tax=unclassified Streptomyces TaxID=2593676 RepID=UPI0036999991
MNAFKSACIDDTEAATGIVAGTVGDAVGAGAGIIVVPLFLYFLLVTPFCCLVGSKTSAKMGWLFSAGLVFMPLALLISFRLAA